MENKTFLVQIGFVFVMLGATKSAVGFQSATKSVSLQVYRLLPNAKNSEHVCFCVKQTDLLFTKSVKHV